ncbi:polysaccharide lyase family 1 protein [Morchella snyderi]|nr:polysaccharide lyase family 1 protein [Morchella snyderi]
MKFFSLSLRLLSLASLGFVKGQELFPQVGYSTLNGGTTGGTGGTVTTVSTSAALIAAVKGDAKKIVQFSVPITLTARPKIGSNTSLIGIGTNAIITGKGLDVSSVSNVIIRNIATRKIVGNDAISVKSSTNVWIDHCDFSSDVLNGFDYYDGLVDVTSGSDYVTLSYNYFHAHFKTSLVGGSPDATDETYHITYHHNFWENLSTRTPALRFSFAHVYNNYYKDIFAQAIHTRSGAQALIEYNVFRNVTECISTYGMVIPQDSPNSSPDGDYEPDGYANEQFNDFGGYPKNITRVGSLTSVPYTYTATPLDQVVTVVVRDAGLGKI